MLCHTQASRTGLALDSNILVVAKGAWDGWVMNCRWVAVVGDPHREADLGVRLLAGEFATMLQTTYDS